MKKIFYLFSTFFLFAVSLNANGDKGIKNNGGDDRQQEYQLQINKTSEKIKLDGKLEEAVWQNANEASDFWYSFPIDDKRAELSTKVKVTYDDDFIYVAATMHDPNAVSYTHLRAHETRGNLVCRLLLEKKKT